MSVDLPTVTESAKQFLLKAGHIFSTLQSAEFDKSAKHWTLVFDVGLTNPKPKKVILDELGKVISLE